MGEILEKEGKVQNIEGGFKGCMKGISGHGDIDTSHPGPLQDLRIVSQLSRGENRDFKGPVGFGFHKFGEFYHRHMHGVTGAHRVGKLDLLRSRPKGQDKDEKRTRNQGK